MDTRAIVVVAIAVILAISLAVYTGMIPLPGDRDTDPAADLSSTSTPADTDPNDTPEPAAVSAPGGIRTISAMVIWAEPADLGGFGDLDGLVVKYRFYDGNNRHVTFDGSSVSMEVSVYTPDIDRRGFRISPRLLYRGFATISRSLPEGDFPLRGIWIPYHELSFNEQDRGIGRIHVKAMFPDGTSVKAEEWYIWPVRR
ncbi:hypothetical protein RJ53_06630 [Methanocalculus chunghsingensis]|uniref:Uncharacterized protein n=1 Tax=Methanocalculus chunghsingensis TaxID=156457 RepID=A0A8J7WA91_9EURY|nr:hypothetical protein [Methanocalculus chunghsingensis]MBR1369185.1 hypothetical protein [Methanocalculus chunghsingensis]